VSYTTVSYRTDEVTWRELHNNAAKHSDQFVKEINHFFTAYSLIMQVDDNHEKEQILLDLSQTISLYDVRLDCKGMFRQRTVVAQNAPAHKQRVEISGTISKAINSANAKTLTQSAQGSATNAHDSGALC